MIALRHFRRDLACPTVLLLGLAGGLTAAPSLRADGNEVPGGVAGMAAREAQRRQQQVETAQTLFTTGSRLLADKSYGEAMDNFKAAFETLPPVPAVADQRRTFFQRYQSSAVRYAELMIDEARWKAAEQTLTEVVTLARDTNLPAAAIDPDVREILGDLKTHDDRYNQANSPRHLRNVRRVESELYLGEGYLELGDYDRAERAYHNVLDIDPTNKAARRGLESVQRHRMDYQDVARDQTRARMLREVAAGWETPVPPTVDPDIEIGLPTDTANGGRTALERKLDSIVLPSVQFEQASLSDVVGFLTRQSREQDDSTSDPSQKGVDIVIDASAAPGSDPGSRRLTVSLSNIPLRDALRYVTGQVGMKYRVDNFAVSIVPQSDSSGAGLITRRYTVPPGFISSDTPGGGDGGGSDDPFAEPEPERGIQVKRISARDFLEQNGVAFSEGASARFVSSTSTLVVRNTADQLATVENLVSAARRAGAKMVRVKVKMISIEDEVLKQAGLDFLLGSANVGARPRVFFGGGTDGNATNPTQAADFPFVTPGGAPVGMNPVTAGLRTGDLATTQSIEDVINRDAPDAGSGKPPGVFSLAGVFTDPQFQAVLRAVSQLKGSDTLCETGVVVRPGQLASIEQAREFIYPTEYDPPEIPNQFGVVDVGNVRIIGPPPPNFPVTPATPTAFETRKLGKVIEVEPTVADDNLTVNVSVTADFSEFVGFIDYGTPIRNSNFRNADGSASVITDNEILMPVFDAVKETTNVNIWDGQTLVIGGLHGQTVTESEDKIPYIGDLPVLGRAFRSTTYDTDKRALLLFVTVRLIDPGGQPINAPAEAEETITRNDVTSVPSIDGAPPVPRDIGPAK